MQEEKSINERAKKLLERLNEIYKQICELTEQKKKLIDEYQEKLKQIESEIVSLFMEAGKILDELEDQYDLTINDIKGLLKSIPDKFFKNALSTYKKKPSRTDVKVAVEQTYELIKEDDASSPAILKALKTIQRGEATRVSTSIKKSREVFFCPLCQEEHDKDTEYDTLHVCRQCKSLLETWLIGMDVFKNHGNQFILEWKARADALRRLKKLEEKYNHIIRYLRNRNIAIPSELLEETA